jgi:hypothetical protein
MELLVFLLGIDSFLRIPAKIYLASTYRAIPPSYHIALPPRNNSSHNAFSYAKHFYVILSTLVYSFGQKS